MKKRKSKFTIGDFKLKVKKSATGRGLFAMEEIPKNSCIIEYKGAPISKEEEEKMSGKYIFEVGRGMLINGNIKNNDAKYINHSCRPNCEAYGPRGKVYILSTKKIKIGEELTYDYGEEYFDEHIKPIGCRCVKCA